MLRSRADALRLADADKRGSPGSAV